MVVISQDQATTIRCARKKIGVQRVPISTYCTCTGPGVAVLFNLGQPMVVMVVAVVV